MSLPYQSLNQPVITSLSIAVKDDDSFFAPTRLAHTGFGFDGRHYTSGVPDAGHSASWATERLSATRGPLTSFPTEALVLVCRASITIFDASSDSLNLWMLFYLADSFAYPVNFTSGVASFIAASISFADGLLSVVLKADPGSMAAPVAVLTFDFGGDAVYSDVSLAPVDLNRPRP